MTRVGVFGVAGRMGKTVAQAVAAEPSLELVAAVSPNHAGKTIAEVAGVDGNEINIVGSSPELDANAIDVMIDFTHLEVSHQNMAYCADNGIHAVVGTSGFSEADYAAISAQFTKSNCLIAANFAVGAVLMMRFAEMASPFFETAEIVETHHDGKKDSPSGTAMATAERMATASTDWAPDPTTSETLTGARGAKGAGDIPIHSIRMRGMTAHQEIVFGTTSQSLTLRHDSYDRWSFMPGVVLAAQKVQDLDGLTIGLDKALGL